MALISKNPTTEEVFGTFPELTDEQLAAKLALAETTFNIWSQTPLEERLVPMKRLSALFRERAPELGKLATLEMGKPITQAIAEVEKCSLACDYYIEQAAKILAPQTVASDASESFVRFDPIGVVLAVMPWNFPFWQVMRFAGPALAAGNVGVLKHASNVPQCAVAFEKLFLEAGFPEGCFQNLAIGSSKVEQVIRHRAIQGVALTGSEQAGSKVAALAGSLIKKTVLELGGSDPFIVLEDADLSLAAEAAAKARLQNNGQSCIAAKRFIVVEAVYDQFLSLFKDKVEASVVGDPLDATTTVGPLASEAGLQEIDAQVSDSVAKGARLVTGGQRLAKTGYFYAPTILADVKPGMRAYEEELFGPVASVIRAKDTDDAIRLANDNRFGLGSSLWTKDLERAKQLAPLIRAGSVFVNGMVKSDPRLPFGGTGVSGYGRELSSWGLYEFMNVKTVWIK
ncbi:NAD-dependent succinate-semialdehyde dehydrogenase [Patescibacteria group bacterium]|nr:NAD-dependent succinate-semialdehyde dehydrogenase [Patescibacteria group bacterium]